MNFTLDQADPERKAPVPSQTGSRIGFINFPGYFCLISTVPVCAIPTHCSHKRDFYLCSLVCQRRPLHGLCGWANVSMKMPEKLLNLTASSD